MNNIQFFEVGGAVRDSLLGISTKDIDFTVVIDAQDRTVAELFGAMRDEMVAQGFKPHKEDEKTFCIRARVPEGHPLRSRTKDADFVLARKDGPYSDGRHPDWVRPGTLQDDLARRDFTVNAIARDVEGKLIDPFDGQLDLDDGILRFVGDPGQRIIEDGLRVVRGLRFMVTKDLDPEPGTWSWMNGSTAAEALSLISIERINDEISRMFEFNSLAAIGVIDAVMPDVQDAIFRDGFHLTGSLKGREM